MIWESSYWKEDLLLLSEKINKEYRVNTYSEQLGVEFEKDVMFALYSVRKLIEASKVSTNISGRQLKVQTFRNMKNVTKMNWHRINELFDLKSPTKENIIGASTLYNQIIHSYIFIISTDDEDVIDGFFFCSDKTRNEKLYHIELKEFDKFIKVVGSDYPNEGQFVYDEWINDYRVYARTKQTTIGKIYYFLKSIKRKF